MQLKLVIVKFFYKKPGTMFCINSTLTSYKGLFTKPSKTETIKDDFIGFFVF